MMKKLRLGILVFLIFFLFPIFVSAERILLKTGQTVEGAIKEHTGKYIKIDFKGVDLVYYTDEIENINGKKLPDISQDNKSALKPQINETPQNFEQLNIDQSKDIKQNYSPEVTQITSIAIQESSWETKPVKRQVPKYTMGLERQTNKSLFPVTAGLAGVFGMFLVFVIVSMLIFYIYSSICLQLIAKKTSQEPSWFAWVPIANLFLCCKIAGLNYIWLLILFVSLVPIIGSLCVGAFFAYLWYRIAFALNKPGWLGALVIIPVVNLAIMGYLAFSKD